MDLTFQEVYLLTGRGVVYLAEPQICFGAKLLTVPDPESGKERSVLRYLVPNDGLGHEIYVASMETVDGRVRVVDADRRTDDGTSPVLWTFEILDESNWESMRDRVVGYDRLCVMCPTVAEVREYYRQQWLDNGWWVEN